MDEQYGTKTGRIPASSLMNFDAEPKDIDVPADQLDMKAFTDLATRYRELKDLEEELDASRKEAKKERESLNEILYDQLTSASITKLAVDGVGTFSAKMENACSIIADKTDGAFDLLEEQGLGASIRRQVHYQTLNKHYREGELQIPEGSEFFKTWSRKTISMRRTNVRKFD